MMNSTVNMSEIMALIVTGAFKVLYRMSGKVLALVPFISCMAGKVFVMTHVRHEYHIKVKKSGGGFKLSQQYSCTSILSCWIVIWTESKNKKKWYMNQKSRLQA